MGVACERRWERAGQEEEEVELWKTGEGLKEEVVGDDRSGGLRGRSKFGPRLAGKQTEWGYRIWLLSLSRPWRKHFPSVHFLQGVFKNRIYIFYGF